MFTPTVKEITNWDRSELERAFRESQQRLTDMVENAPMPMILQDLTFRYVLANQYARSMFWHGSDMVGKRPFDVWPPDTAARFVERAGRVVRTQEPSTSEDVLPHPDGERTMLIHRFPLRDTNGNTSLIAAVGVDITAQKRAEAEAREAADQVNRAGREALSHLCERMQSPLDAVIEHARRLHTAPLSPAAAASVECVLTAAGDLLAIIGASEGGQIESSGGVRHASATSPVASAPSGTPSTNLR